MHREGVSSVRGVKSNLPFLNSKNNQKMGIKLVKSAKDLPYNNIHERR